jgi:hypothetical protein
MVPVLVPPEREKTTVAPPEGREFPFASLAVRVSVMFDPDATVAEETVMRD